MNSEDLSPVLAVKIGEILECVEVAPFEDEWVYDVVMEDPNIPYFFANDILVHNSNYYKIAGVDNLEDAVKRADEIADLVNESFPGFMRNAFNCQPGYDDLIKCGREIVADTGKLKDFILYHHEGKPLIVSIPISDHVLHAQVWHRILADNVHILLLDTNIAENNEERKNVTSKLYDPHFYTRVQQQILLGLGGMQILKVLDIHPTIYHLNEGHTAFGGVAVMVERKEDLSKVVGTKHTILSEAGLHIPRKDFAVLLGAYCKEHGADALEVFEKGKYELDPDIFSTTKFVMNISNRKNSVSALHAVFEKKRHPHSLLIPITNGVYEKRWQAKELLVRDSDISDKDLWTIKRKLRSNLFNYLHENLGKELNPDICTVVWARRFAAYKRPFLLFSDYERIVKLLSNREHPVQFIISGRAHV